MTETKGHPPIPLSGGAFELSDLDQKVQAAIAKPDAERDGAIAEALRDANKAETAKGGEVVDGDRIRKVKGQDGNTYDSLVAVQPADAETKDTGTTSPTSTPAGGRGNK